MKYIDFISFPEKNVYILITEFSDYMSLESLLKIHKMNSSNQEKFFRKLFNAVSYMHEENILHRDLNVENLLICPMTFDFKIIDFGIAIDLKKHEWVLNDEGNYKYRIKDSDYSCDDPLRIDYWGLFLITLSLQSHENITTREAIKTIQENKSDLIKNPYSSRALNRSLSDK